MAGIYSVPRTLQRIVYNQKTRKFHIASMAPTWAHIRILCVSEQKSLNYEKLILAKNTFSPCGHIAMSLPDHPALLCLCLCLCFCLWLCPSVWGSCFWYPFWYPLLANSPFSPPVGVCAQWLDGPDTAHIVQFALIPRVAQGLPKMPPPPGALGGNTHTSFFRAAYFGWTLFNKAICAWLTLVIVCALAPNIWPGTDNLCGLALFYFASGLCLPANCHNLLSN